MAKLKWKRERDEGFKPSFSYRLRRGELTLATVAQDGQGTWYFYGRVPGGGGINTTGRPAPQSCDDVEAVRRAAVEWVKRRGGEGAGARGGGLKMPRFLASLYPCKGCGKKVPARNLREAEHPRCERCEEYWRLGGLANMRADAAKRLLSPPAADPIAPGLAVEVKASPGTRQDRRAVVDGQVSLEAMLEAVTKYAGAAQAAIEASRLSPKRGEAMLWAQWAETWTRRAFDTMKRLRTPLLQYARHERFVRAVDGGGEVAQAAGAEVRAPLRLVVPGKPLPAAERSAMAMAAERWAAIREKLYFRRSVAVPAHWPEERVREDRWIFHFAPTERRRKPWDVWLREWAHLANLTEHRVAPAHATGAEARAWAVAFAREVGFAPLELTSPGKVVTLNLAGMMEGNP